MNSAFVVLMILRHRFTATIRKLKKKIVLLLKRHGNYAEYLMLHSKITDGEREKKKQTMHMVC